MTDQPQNPKPKIVVLPGESMSEFLQRMEREGHSVQASSKDEKAFAIIGGVQPPPPPKPEPPRE